MKEYFTSLAYKYKFFLIGLLCISIFGGLSGSFINYQVKEIIDTLGSDKSADLASTVSMFAVYTALNHLVFFCSRLLDIRYKPKLLAEIVESAYRKTMKHSLHWFDSHLSGEISSKITDLQDSIITIITVVSRSNTMVCFVVIGLILVFQVHMLPGLILVSFLIIYSLVVSRLLKKQLALQEEYNSARQQSVGIINDSVSNIFGIKVIGNLMTELKMKLLPSLANWSGWDRKTRLYDAWYVDMADTILSVIMNTTNIFVLGYLYKTSQITAGEFAFIVGVSIQIHYDMDFLLQNIMFQINPKIATIKASFKFINSDSDPLEDDSLQVMPRDKGEIVFENVQFSYNKQKEVFDGLNLKIDRGQKVGIVGTSGAGKTTLIKCLLKYFPLEDGCITVDAYSIAEHTEESVRANISVIPQDITMFHRSILENLQLARQDASFDEIVTACKKAKIHDDIDAMPSKYETIVGERGVKLSGGQRQRIAIARAILKDAPILILDEATSALDSQTEKLIQESLWELMSDEAGDRTTIVIAHRLSTLLNMDRIIVMEHGKIVEDGTHSELLAREGLYKKLWDSQVGGFIGEM